MTEPLPRGPPQFTSHTLQPHYYENDTFVQPQENVTIVDVNPDGDEKSQIHLGSIRAGYAQSKEGGLLGPLLPMLVLCWSLCQCCIFYQTAPLLSSVGQ